MTQAASQNHTQGMFPSRGALFNAGRKDKKQQTKQMAAAWKLIGEACLKELKVAIKKNRHICILWM